jgi:hypothetical protein
MSALDIAVCFPLPGVSATSRNVAERHGSVAIVKPAEVSQISVIDFLPPLKVALKKAGLFD